MSYDEPLNPAQAEAWVRRMVTALTEAWQALRDARDQEVEAKHRLAKAKREAWFSPQCPTPSRGGPTVSDRDEWVAAQVEAEQVAYDLAVVKRETAADHLRTLRDQAELVRTLSASVRTAYGMAGVAER